MEVINVALNLSAIAEQYCKALWISNTCYIWSQAARVGLHSDSSPRQIAPLEWTVAVMVMISYLSASALSHPCRFIWMIVYSKSIDSKVTSSLGTLRGSRLFVWLCGRLYSTGTRSLQCLQWSSLHVDPNLVDPLPVGRDPLEPVTFKYTIGPSPSPQQVQGVLLAGILNPDSCLLH